MMIYDVKEDPILQDSSQEPSMSSMYDFCNGVLYTLLLLFFVLLLLFKHYYFIMYHLLFYYLLFIIYQYYLSLITIIIYITPHYRSHT